MKMAFGEFNKKINGKIQNVSPKPYLAVRPPSEVFDMASNVPKYNPETIRKFLK